MEERIIFLVLQALVFGVFIRSRLPKPVEKELVTKTLALFTMLGLILVCAVEWLIGFGDLFFIDTILLSMFIDSLSLFVVSHRALLQEERRTSLSIKDDI